MSLDEKDPVVEAAVLGKRIESFIESDIGQYLLGRSDNKMQDAMYQLRNVAPWRTRRIRELQNEIFLADSFKQWLQDGLSEGIAAMHIIEEQ